MRKRLTILLLLVGMAGSLAACRELTAPGSSGPTGPIELLVLDEYGEATTLKDVWVTNLAYVTTGPPTEWRGTVSEGGRVTVDLPEGRYDVVVYTFGNTFTRWVQPEVDLREGLTILDPRPQLRPGRISIPEALDPESYRINLEATLTHGVEPVRFDLEAFVDPNGEFVAPLIEDASYVVDLVRFATRVRLHDDLVPGTTDSLHFEWTPEEFQIHLTLGGDPLPPSLIRIVAETWGSSVTTEFVPDGPISSYFGHSGVGEITVRHSMWLPFLDYEAPFEFRSDEIPHIELGDHRVKFNMADSAGNDLYGCYVRAIDANTGAGMSKHVDQPQVTFFLRPGQYKLEVSRTGFERAELIADVTSDSTFTFVLEDEAP